MQYMALIYEADGAGPEAGTAEHEAMMAGYWEFTEKGRADGVVLAGEALHGPEAATTVRVRGGDVLTTDGPFTETKEVLGGFYLLECPDLDQAIAYAARIPSAAWGSIEVRPVIDMSQLPGAPQG